MRPLLPTRAPFALETTKGSSLDPETLQVAGAIVEAVRSEGDRALARSIKTFEGRSGDPLVLTRDELEAATRRVTPENLALLRRTAARIRSFAEAQRACLSPLKQAIPGGAAGHTLAPVERVACYAPGGRFPLPSSVLMTAVTARAAGVRDVYVVTPSSDDIMLAAAFIAGADGLIWAGGAHAIAAVAFGTESVSPVDMIVGPGNRWVTAAKQLVSGRVGIDMLAGPSELLVLADEAADPAWIAADLLAQAEHDPDAVPILLTTSETVVTAVRVELARQLERLETASIARTAVENGAAVCCETWEQATALANRIGPEHLEIQHEQAETIAARLTNYGGLFIGRGSAEVLGDYGAGPNHVLPTSGTSRYTGGLSVFTFLRVRTWLQITELGDARELVEDATALAGLEGLCGHARSAQIRQVQAKQPEQETTARQTHLVQSAARRLLPNA